MTIKEIPLYCQSAKQRDFYYFSVKNREDLKQSSVYFLFGTSDTTGKNVVYIGQAGARKNGEGILNRLQEHRLNPNKDYCTEAVAFTTSNNTFGPSKSASG